MRFFITILIIFCSHHLVMSQAIDLNKEFLEIENAISVMEKTNPSVSQSPVKWHLLHLLGVINTVIDEASNSNEADYNPKSNFNWFYVSTFQKMPRGKVEAPDKVNPNLDISQKDIRTELENAKLSLSKWSDLNKNNFYEHHVLLHLNKSKLRKFLKIHTRHHLKIVRDIITD